MKSVAFKLLVWLLMQNKTVSSAYLNTLTFKITNQDWLINCLTSFTGHFTDSVIEFSGYFSVHIFIHNTNIFLYSLLHYCSDPTRVFLSHS